MRGQISFHTLHFAELMNVAMHAYTQWCALPAQTLDWPGICRSSARSRASSPLRKDNNSLGTFNLNIFLETKPIQHQGKVKKEKDHAAHDGKSNSKTENDDWMKRQVGHEAALQAVVNTETSCWFRSCQEMSVFSWISNWTRLLCWLLILVQQEL